MTPKEQEIAGSARVTRAELVWPGKFNDDGTARELPRPRLPFQVIEAINESRASRESGRHGKQSTLFEIYEGREGETFELGWRNKLIWGDNRLVMSSLLEKFAGKVKLIYIDPPFATGADFSFRSQVGDGDLEIEKESSIIEEKAYRDTWGRGIASFVQMLYDRFHLIHELLAENGSLYVHIGWEVSHYAKLALDEVFGSANLVNQVIWKRQAAHADIGQGSTHFGPIHDVIFLYCKGDKPTWNMQYLPYSEEYVKSAYKHVDETTRRKYRIDNTSGPGGARKGNPFYEFRGVKKYWRYSLETLNRLFQEGRLVQTREGGDWGYKRYLDEMKGVPLQDLWLDIPPIQSQSAERTGYETQKPEALLERIIKTSSNEGDLVADFFAGSGTTLAVAEKLKRRWIGGDLSRWAIHVARKRMLEIAGCKPFEVLNLGKYERQYWQTTTFGKAKAKGNEQAIFEYLAFVLKLYNAQPVTGMNHLHGRKGRSMIHIGAVDAPVTINDIDVALAECAKLKQDELHVLGWEWEMGIYNLMPAEAKKRGVKLLLLQIPREVMEVQAVDADDIKFFELAYLEANPKVKGQNVTVELRDFVIPNTELIPDEIRAKVKKWSDYVDYWAVDWDFKDDTFIQGFVSYRTAKDRELVLSTDVHTYQKPGKHRVVVKVIDIFGNDTSQVLDVDVK